MVFTIHFNFLNFPIHGYNILTAKLMIILKLYIFAKILTKEKWKF